MKNWLAGVSRSRVTQSAMVVGIVSAVVAVASVAGATGPYVPTTVLKSFAASFSVVAGSIILPVAVAMVGLVVLFWAIRFVFGFLRGHR